MSAEGGMKPRSIPIKALIQTHRPTAIIVNPSPRHPSPVLDHSLLDHPLLDPSIHDPHSLSSTFLLWILHVPFLSMTLLFSTRPYSSALLNHSPRLCCPRPFIHSFIHSFIQKFI